MDTPNKPVDDQHDIIYVLRTAQQHHVQLSMIADQKANIILGSFLIFITVTQAILENNQQLTIPIWILTVAYTLSAFFGLLVITPRFRDKKAKPDSKPGNLLFFGSFSALTQDEYIKTLSSNLRTNREAHELLMKDIYQIGQILQKKYANLRLSYGILACGVAASLVAFSVVQAV